jgi:general secretion pathway protein K
MLTKCFSRSVKSSGIKDDEVRGGKEADLSSGQAELEIPTLFPGRRHAAEEGFALLIVLWWLVLVALLVMQITTATRTALMISANIRSSAVAEAQADGAVSEAIFHVLAQDWKADGATYMVRGTQAVAEVRIYDEGGRIDPNVAPAVLMQALLRECGATPKAAAELGDAISEWRSLDLLRSADTAATAARYRDAGKGYVPPRARFVSEDELGLVLGMTSELLACLEPHISVYSLSVPSLQTTTDPVVRQALTDAYPYDSPQMASAAVREAAVIRVTAIAQQTNGGSRFRRVAVVRVVPAEPDQNFIYKILSWEGSAD